MTSSFKTARRTRQARWCEPILLDLGTPGERGIIPPEVEPEVAIVAGDVLSRISPVMRRQAPPALPEISQAEVLRHYLRLSQETIGTDVGVDIGKGTCTFKYSPKVNEQMGRLPEMTELHPLQDESTVQGILQVMYEFEQMIKEVSGMDRFSFQPGGGSQAIYTNACLIRAHHEFRGEAGKRNEIITTVYSHPVNAACPATAGFKVITLQPGENGYSELDDLKRAVSDRTAGMLITNPEDTGIFNPRVDEYVKVVHDAGGLCSYDQANANGILGITRAREAGFDLCHFNLHKTFSTPHGSGGPGAGAVGVTSELEKFLPSPLVDFDGKRYFFDYNRPHSIGKVRMFHGAAMVVLRAYAWVMSLGADGLTDVAEIAVLNNNYLLKKMLEIRGVAIPYPDQPRIEQVRYTLKPMLDETGVSSSDVRRRVTEHGAHYWLSHHPFLIPEPATMEPGESYSKSEIDDYVALVKKVSDEAYETPDVVKNSPHDGIIHRIDESALDDPKRWAVTWRAYKRKNGK